MPAEPLRVAAIGDSVMWGQGVARDKVFATRAAREIGRIAKRPLEMVQFSARSGAKIRAETGEAEAFVALYPSLAARPEEVEDASGNLFGGVPSTFPTITHQLETLIDDTSDLDLLILDGGANDMDFKSLLDPRGDKDYVAVLDPEFEEKIYSRMHGLLRQACEHFPRTQIMVTGYFPGLSDLSRREDLERLVKHGLKDAVGNDVIGIFAYHVYHLATFLTPWRSVGEFIEQAKSQASYGHTRGLYWLRKAVSDCNAALADAPPSEGRRPVIFVHPAFADFNAIFAVQSFQHENYALDKVNDPMAEARAERCPRGPQLAQMEELFSMIIQSDGLPSPDITDKIDQLLDEIDGPRPLVDALNEFRDPLSALTALKTEIGRVEATRIASFFHPNEDGAARYTERIVQRWRAVHDSSGGSPGAGTPTLGDGTSDDITILPVGDGVSIDLPEGTTGGVVVGDKKTEKLRRFGIIDARAAAEVETIDSIAVRIETRDDSAPKLPGAIELDLGTGRHWSLNHFVARVAQTSHFVPGGSDLFTIDPLQDIDLTDIKCLELHRVPHPDDPPLPIDGGDVKDVIWRPRRVALEINGVTVFHSDLLDETIGLGRHLVLPYPTGSDSKGDRATVPDVEGRPKREAMDAIEAEGLVVHHDGSEFSELPSGRVLSQEPDGGRLVEKGTRVSLTISRGKLPISPDPRAVPDVIGMHEERAFSALRQVGFQVGAAFADSDRPFQEVIGQQPKAGTNVLPGAKVRLFLSKGPKDKPGDRDGNNPKQPL